MPCTSTHARHSARSVPRWVSQLRPLPAITRAFVPRHRCGFLACHARDVPRTAGVTAVSAHRLLHLYLGRPTIWRGYANVLDDHQQKCLQPRWLTNPGQPICEPVFTGTDVSLLAALREDGRASYADLAAATGRSPATVARRLEFLRASGSLYFEVDMDPAAFGISTRTFLWMEVAPDRLDQIAMRLSGHEE